MTYSSLIELVSVRAKKTALAFIFALFGLALVSDPLLAGGANVFPGAPPVVTSAYFSLPANPAPGSSVGTITATVSPTSWSLSGAGSQYFVITVGSKGWGVVTVGASSPPSGSYNLIATATNKWGSGSGTLGITVAAPAINGACGPANGQSLSSAPTTGLCSAGTASSVSGSGPWTWTCAGSGGGTTASCSASLQSSSGSPRSYSATTWSNYPQDPNYFPTVLWLQDLRTTIPGYSSFLAAMKGTGMNTLLDLNGYTGGLWWPSSFGVDNTGFFAQIAAAGVYLIPQVNSATNLPSCIGGCIGNLSPNNTDVNSVASYQALIAKTGLKSTIIGYVMADEPQTGSCTRWPLSGIPTEVAIYKSYDSTRPFLLNSMDYIFNSGWCPGTVNQDYMKATPIGSMDSYPLINPWTTSNAAGTGTPVDSLWIQGWSVAQMVSQRPAGAPFWAFVDSGSDALGFGGSGNGFTCNTSTNTCTNGSWTIYQRAPANLVNAEVWMSIINGAAGIEYFCEDTTASFAYCMGQGGSVGALAAQANVTYINSNLKSFAQVLNSPTVGRCTMNTGMAYANYTTSCSNGILTITTGTSTVPASALVKSYSGATYLIAQPDRNGSAAFTFTLTGLAGKTAKVVYDSNSRYDSANTSLGSTFTLNSAAQFTDKFAANGDNYQVKIYQIQ
ncbi:hypothetical protein [Methylocystis bryophila]|uniref:hypothetical protein n=1 Tax=Methylocystis bryophila TaxID=655015 RepID=UPI003DB10B40